VKAEETAADKAGKIQLPSGSFSVADSFEIFVDKCFVLGENKNSV